MCGIAGIFRTEERVCARQLDMATGALRHRGPDGTRTWIDHSGQVGLGHARLAVIDLQTGNQPMHSVDGRFSVVFNGEIFNYRELRNLLVQRGQQFRTQSDTEVLLAAFAEWGSACLDRLDGMFAFALYDRDGHRLFLSRDRVGIKPLYVYAEPRFLIFGSELKSLLSWPDVPRSVDVNALVDYLRLGYTMPPRTCFRDIGEVKPGTVLEFSGGRLQESRFWTWTPRQADTDSSDVDQLESDLRETVCDHLVADVPVGAFLSGGIDSSLMVALLARQQRIATFSVKFEETSYDESHYARMVARHCGTLHTELHVCTRDCDLDLVDRILDQFDQPFADSSAIPTYLICREIRAHAKVAIGGDGGDEMFGGYPRFVHADAVRLIGTAPRWALRAAASVAASGSLNPTVRRQCTRLVRAAQARGTDRLVSICSLVDAAELPSILHPEFAHAAGLHRTCFAMATDSNATGGRELVDATILSTLPGDYLRKIDICSSAHGLEVRVPFLGRRILDFSAALPLRRKYTWTRNKVLLRKLAAKYLPPEVVRKKKQGFGIPLDTWLGPDGRRRLRSRLLDDRAALAQVVQREYLENLLDSFVTRSWDVSRMSRFGLYQRVYALWSLQRWLRRWEPSW